jgi:hypothetical protein
MLKAQRPPIAWWMPNAQPMADHGFDGTAHGHKPRRWGVLQRPVKLLAQARFVIPAGHKTDMVQDFATVPSRHNRRRS